jgi:hypothetical protein
VAPPGRKAWASFPGHECSVVRTAGRARTPPALRTQRGHRVLYRPAAGPILAWPHSNQGGVRSYKVYKAEKWEKLKNFLRGAEGHRSRQGPIETAYLICPPEARLLLGTARARTWPRLQVGWRWFGLLSPLTEWLILTACLRTSATSIRPSCGFPEPGLVGPIRTSSSGKSPSTTTRSPGYRLYLCPRSRMVSWSWWKGNPGDAGGKTPVRLPGAGAASASDPGTGRRSMRHRTQNLRRLDLPGREMERTMTRAERAQQLWSLLAWAASNRQILTYDIVARLTGVVRPSIGDFLRPIQQFCTEEGLPPLKAWW